MFRVHPPLPELKQKKRKSRKISSNSSVLAIIPENNSIHSEFNPSALKDSTTPGMETRSAKKLKRTGMNGLDPDETPKKKTKKKQKKK